MGAVVKRYEKLAYDHVQQASVHGAPQLESLPGVPPPLEALRDRVTHNANRGRLAHERKTMGTITPRGFPSHALTTTRVQTTCEELSPVEPPNNGTSTGRHRREHANAPDAPHVHGSPLPRTRYWYLVIVRNLLYSRWHSST